MMKNNLVLTPGGYRHPSLVHRVDPGHALQVTEKRLRIMNMASKAVIDIPEVSVQPDDVPTSFGSGWIVYGTWTNTTGNPITSFRTTWTVPPAPKTQSGQTIFLFNGIDPANPSDAILQPVLQWGVSAAGGGPYWSIASWYVTGTNQAFHTPLVQVSTGDVLFGAMTLTGQTGTKFNYNCEFAGKAGTSLPIQNVNELVWCNQTLEAYGITKCSDYPATGFTAFRSIAIQTGASTPTLNWTPVNVVTDCGQHAVVVNNSATSGRVELWYRASEPRFPWENLAQQVQILFGVTNDGGGVVILPNGQVIHIPPNGPDGPMFHQIAEGLADLGRGLGISQIVQGTTLAGIGESMSRQSREMMLQAIQGLLDAVKTDSR